MNSVQPTFPARFDVAGIAKSLGALASRFDVHVLAECDSTNSRLMTLAEGGAPSGSVVVAERQLAGRGRRGNSWLSDPDASLTFSLLWRFPPQVQLTGLSLAVGVALAYALEGLGVKGVALKWPNDVLLRESKLAGILIEVVPGGARPSAVVIGVGINLRLPPELPAEIRQHAAALSDAGVAMPTHDALLARLLTELHGVLQAFSASGFSVWRAAWQSRHAYTGQTVRLLADHAAPIEGRCQGVDDDGALLLETAAGLQRIISGEVSLRKS